MIVSQQLTANRDVVLAPVAVVNLLALYEAETQPHVVEHIWRGATPTFERWADGLFVDAFFQVTVCDRNTEEILGRVKAYDASREQRWCYVSAIRYQEGGFPIRFVQGFVLFLDVLLGHFDTLYFDADEATLGQFRSFTRHLDGKDPYALTRETWDRDGKRFVDWASS